MGRKTLTQSINQGYCCRRNISGLSAI